MPSKVYKEYKSLTLCETPDWIKNWKCRDLVPLKDEQIYHSFEVIPYKPPPVYRSMVTVFLPEKRKAPKTLIIPIRRELEIESPPKRTKKSSYKCVTFTLDETNDCYC